MVQKVDRSKLSPDDLTALEIKERKVAKEALSRLLKESLETGKSVQLPKDLVDRSMQPTTRERIAIKKRERLDEIRKRQLTETVSIPVGVHTGCGGKIWYDSRFECIEKDFRNIRIGGYNPIEEVAKCSCKMCGQLFDTELPIYRNQITTHRHRTPKGDEDV